MPRDDYEEFDEESLGDEQEEPDEDIAVEDEDDWEDEVDPDNDVADIFNEAQHLDYGRGDLTRKLRSYTDKSPKLSGGDIDADWANADVGEEAVGGQNPTPDQSDVDEIGEAMGVVYEDDESLDTVGKLEERDKEPWELNPSSTLPEFGARAKRELERPLPSVASNVQRKRTSPNASAEKSARAGVGGKASTPVDRRIRNTETAHRGNVNSRETVKAGRAEKGKRPITSTASAQTTTRQGGTGRSQVPRASRRRASTGRQGSKRG